MSYQVKTLQANMRAQCKLTHLMTMCDYMGYIAMIVKYMAHQRSLLGCRQCTGGQPLAQIELFMDELGGCGVWNGVIHHPLSI